MKRLIASCIIALLAFFQPPPLSAEESHPGMGVESMYSEAVLAYNRKQSNQALSVLDQLLKAQPDHIEALELKALTLKEKGQETRSLDVYKRLIELKPVSERGPYHFQLGVILNDQKKPMLARPHFERAAILKFNEVPSRLFLGLIAFNAGDMTAAYSNFNKIRISGSTEFKVVARYYLGLINFKNGFSAGGTSELLSARALAAEVPESKMASDIRAAANRILEPFNLGQWFANISILTQYDSNIAQIPSSGQSSSQPASGMATPKFSLSAGVGHMGSPLQALQLVWSVRTSLNRNLNSQTHSYEYFAGTGSLYLNYQPLLMTNGGFKLEGTGTFQNQLQDGTTDKYLYSPYNYSADLGPFIRHNLDRSNSLEWGVYFRPIKYTSDATQTGNSIFTRGSWRNDTGSRTWNPGAYLSFEKSRAGSGDYSYTAIGIGGYDVLRLTAKDTVNASLDVNLKNYAEASVPRQDKIFVVRTNLVHALTGKYSLLGDLSYTKNLSSLEEVFSYNEWTIGAGVSWAL